MFKASHRSCRNTNYHDAQNIDALARTNPINMRMKTNIEPTPNCLPLFSTVTNRWFRQLVFLSRLIVLLGLPVVARGQTQPELATTPETFSGVITEVKVGELSVRLDDGQVERYAIQESLAPAVSVAGKAYNIPADVELAGEVPIDLVERGMVVQFQALCTVEGKCSGLVAAAKLINASDVVHPQTSSVNAATGKPVNRQAELMQVRFLERPADDSSPTKVEVTGRVLSFASNKLHLQIQPGQINRQGRIEFDFAANAKLILRERSLDRAVPGDTVRLGQTIVFESGEKVIQRIRIAATGKRNSLTKSFHGKLENKFRHLSNEPSKPREIRSAHFVLQTDISDRSANILLAKLETMFGLVSGYFRQQPQRPIECYIVRDLANWPNELDVAAAKQIRDGSGITVSQGLGDQAKAVVYACDDHAIVQHEAMHAFCAQTFGGLGPVWYSEGMAELGQYWQPTIKGVSIDPIVVSYLRNSPQQKLTDIVSAGQITGDSWQAYAWRWALCHLLAKNSNYAGRFKTLGINLMTGREDSLESTFKNQLKQMSFEYDLFLKNLGNGYRVDLCSWDWKTIPKKLKATDRLDCEVKARAGWQATGLLSEPGQSYDFACRGQWKIDAQAQTTADGDGAGQGALVGVWLSDFQLSEPFRLGTRGKLVAPKEAQLFVRCRDAWTNLGDNEGRVKLFLRKSRK